VQGERRHLQAHPRDRSGLACAAFRHRRPVGPRCRALRRASGAGHRPGAGVRRARSPHPTVPPGDLLAARLLRVHADTGRAQPGDRAGGPPGAGPIDTCLTVGRTLSKVIAQSRTSVTDSALAGIAVRPSPSLRLGMTRGVYSIRDPSGGPETRVYAVGLEGSWRINDWLSL